MFTRYLKEFVRLKFVDFHLPSFWLTLLKYKIHILKGFLNLPLNLSWFRSLSCKNQSIDLHSKSKDWFLQHRDLSHERVKIKFINALTKALKSPYRQISGTQFLSIFLNLLMELVRLIQDATISLVLNAK